MHLITKLTQIILLSLALFLLIGLLVLPKHLLTTAETFPEEPKTVFEDDIFADAVLEELSFEKEGLKKETLEKENRVLKGELTTPSAYALVGQPLVFMATITDSGQTVVGSSELSIKIGSQTYPLYDDGTHNDFQANDGLYLTFTPATTELGYLTATLYFNQAQLGPVVDLNIIDNPDLLVLTDWQALYWEFRDTGMQLDEDVYRNGYHDFFDLMKRINQYATNHRGLVVNLPDAITTQNGYTTNYVDLDYNSDTLTRHQMGQLIDELINNLGEDTSESFKNVALIGDDQVVPFYRVMDPTDFFELYNHHYGSYDSMERAYPSTVGGIQNNPTLADSSQAYIMSDVPYSIYSHQLINSDTWISNPTPDLEKPTPNLGIGRIFALRPEQLIYAIDRYETPVHLTPGQASGAIFATYDSSPYGIKFEELIARSILPEMTEVFSDNLSYYNVVQKQFTPNDFVNASGENDLAAVFAHGKHISMDITPTVSIESDDINALILNNPAVFVGLGCHIGLSVGNYPDQTYAPPFVQTLVNTMVSNGASIFAPSSQAYTWGGLFAEPHFHELMLDQFVNRLLLSGSSTMGEIWQEVFATYNAHDPGLTSDYPGAYLFHIVGAYGYVFYGLPTQQIDREGIEPPCQSIVHQPNKLSPQKIQGSRGAFTITIDIPHFDVKNVGDGKVLFDIPNRGTYLTPPTGPVLPLIIHDVSFPKNLEIVRIRIISTQQVYSESVSLANFDLISTNGDHIPISYTLPLTYPESQFDYSIVDNEAEYLLSLSFVPLQYNANSRRATLYTKMVFAVDYIFSFPTQYPHIANIVVNQNQPLEINQPRYYVDIDVEDTEAKQIDVLWQVRDETGSVIASQKILANTITGTTNISACFNTQGWVPGNHTVLAYVKYEDDDQLNSTTGRDLLVSGLSIEEVTRSSYAYAWHDTQATWQLKLYDEFGRVVTGTAMPTGTQNNPPGTGQLSFWASIDDNPIDITVSEAGTNNGIYNVTLPLDYIQAGNHIVQIGVMDHRGVTGQEKWFVYRKLPKLSISPSVLYEGQAFGFSPLPPYAVPETIIWYRNGTKWDNYSGMTAILSGQIQVDDILTATVELENGILLTSQKVTVLALPQLTISPSMPYSGQALTVAPLHPDIVTATIRWYHNNTNLSLYNGKVTLPIGIIQGGDTAFATAEAQNGVLITSTMVSVSDLPTLTILPPNPCSEDTLNFTISPSVEISEIVWYINGELVTELVNPNEVPSDRLQPDDIVQAIVTIADNVQITSELITIQTCPQTGYFIYLPFVLK